MERLEYVQKLMKEKGELYIGLVGKPGIEKYSRSPVIWNAVFRKMKRKDNFNFKFVGIGSKDIEETLEDIFENGYKQKRDFLGTIITIPWKEKKCSIDNSKLGAMGIIDKYNGSYGKEVEYIGSINNLVITQKDEEILLEGYNTDWIGALSCMEISKRNSDFDSKSSALLYGAGGGGKAIVYALKLFGIKRIYVVEKNESTLYRAEEIRERYKDMEIETVLYSNDVLKNITDDKNLWLIVNATDVGGLGRLNESIISEDEMKILEDYQKRNGRRVSVFDLNYHEPTKLMQIANACGIHAVGGKEMVIAQAKEQAKLFTGLSDNYLDKTGFKEIMYKNF